jgi:hypothetical protein
MRIIVFVELENSRPKFFQQLLIEGVEGLGPGDREGLNPVMSVYVVMLGCHRFNVVFKPIGWHGVLHIEACI